MNYTILISGNTETDGGTNSVSVVCAAVGSNGDSKVESTKAASRTAAETWANTWVSNL